MRTTGVQVSGHAFLLRRLELALVTGDPRMAHDPLRSQRRAVGVGVLLSLLVAGGMLLLALLRPAPLIGDADLVADESSSLYVRLGEAFHPVTNVASARLLLGSPVEVSDTTAARLAEFPAGPPVGIPDVPGLVPASPGQYAAWALCGGTVVAGPGFRDAGPQIVVASSGHWLVVGDVRLSVPEGGPTVARALGAVPVEVDDAVLQVFRRGPDVVLPTGPSGSDVDLPAQGEILTVDDRVFVVAGDGLAEVTGTRRTVVEALSGRVPEEVDLATVLSAPVTDVLTAVPTDLRFREVGQVCAGSSLVESDAHTAAGGERGHYVGPRDTAVLVTERGLVLVSGSGVRYTVGSPEELSSLGLPGGDSLPVAVPWAVIDRLPDGGALTVDRARWTVEVS